LPSTAFFFGGDDWFLLRVAQIHHLPEFINFFSFGHTAQSTSFYRPLPQQLFLFIFSKSFGLNAAPFHVFVLVCFGISLSLLYQFFGLLKLSKSSRLTGTFIYALTAANFARIYFLSAFQDVLLPLFALAALISFLNNRRIMTALFTILALTSKETAIVLPLLFVVSSYFIDRKINWQNVIISTFITGLYIVFRYSLFGFPVGDTYIWDFSFYKSLNTLFWYILWSFGVPEFFVDYIGPGLIPIARFWKDYPLVGPAIFLATAIMIFLLLQQILHYKRPPKLLIMGILIFTISLIPVSFMPTHKFTHALSVPLIGFSISVSYLLHQGRAAKPFLCIYLIVNLVSQNYLYTRHYSVNRSRVSQKVYQLFTDRYPRPPGNQQFVFIGPQNKQLALALSKSDFFRVFYNDNNYQVYYQDIDQLLPTESTITIDSNQFF